jgi:hypothetical protein
MFDALLFRPGAGNDAPVFKVVASEWIGWYRKRGWFLLADAGQVRAAEIEAVRESDETRWNRLFTRW